MAAVSIELLRRRLDQRMKAMDMDQTTLAQRAGLGRTAVGDILRGRNQNPTIGALTAIADALDCDVGYLTGSQDKPRAASPTGKVIGVPVVGTVEAGSFRADSGAEPWLEDYDFETIPAPRSSRRPKAKCFAFRVRGDSMNAAKPVPILEGTYVLCVDVVDAEADIVEGEVYVVRQTTDGGQTYEWTVKRAYVYRDRYELVPESTNPKHKTLVVPKTDSHADGVEIAAVGVVYGLFAKTGRYA